VRARSAAACSRRCCEPKLVFGELLRAVEFERGALAIGLVASNWAAGRLDLALRLGDDGGCGLHLLADAGDRRLLGGDLSLAAATASR